MKSLLFSLEPASSLSRLLFLTLTVTRMFCLAACVGLQDAGLVHLEHLSSLKALNLSGCIALEGSTLHLMRPKRYIGLVTRSNSPAPKTTISTRHSHSHALASSQSPRGSQQLPSSFHHQRHASLAVAPPMPPPPPPGGVGPGPTGCPELRQLNLDDCPLIGRQALHSVSCLASLQHLSLKGCQQVDDEGIRALSRGLTRLMELSLFSASHVTSKSLEYLSRLLHLRSLQLPHCWNIDDAGIQELWRCKSLSYLNVQHCWRVSKHAVQALQRERGTLAVASSKD
jgi:hypothetical protein